MDPIADFLTRIRNAIKANHRILEVPSSNIKKEITKVLFEKGYIQNYKFEDKPVNSTIKIALKYNPETKVPAIKHIERASTPGLRRYSRANKLPWIEEIFQGKQVASRSQWIGNCHPFNQ